MRPAADDRWRVVRQRVGVTSLAAWQADDPQRVGPPDPRRRTRWPWAAGAVAAVGAVTVATVILWLGSSHPAASAGTTTGPATPGATSTPSVGNLQLSQLRVGDCLTGASMHLNTSEPWPN